MRVERDDVIRPLARAHTGGTARERREPSAPRRLSAGARDDRRDESRYAVRSVSVGAFMRLVIAEILVWARLLRSVLVLIYLFF